MDECLDWQGRELPRRIPTASAASCRSISTTRCIPTWPCPKPTGTGSTLHVDEVREPSSGPVHLTYGGWGQDGHIAYNQARRNPFARSRGDVSSRPSGSRRTTDTIIALAQRTFGAACQFVPPLSITLGLKECLSARTVRLFSDTGAWKQTALRVGLFSPPTAEYPLTLLQEHPDALLTATEETARHPLSLHPEWELGLRDA